MVPDEELEKRHYGGAALQDSQTPTHLAVERDADQPGREKVNEQESIVGKAGSLAKMRMGGGSNSCWSRW